MLQAALLLPVTVSLPQALCMLQPVDPTHDPQHLAAQIMVDRKLKQADHLDEYDRAVVGIKAKVREMEGQDMRDAIQDKVRDLQQ